MKIGPFLSEIELKTLKETHFGLWVMGEGRLLEGGVYWVFYGILNITETVELQSYLFLVFHKVTDM